MKPVKSQGKLKLSKETLRDLTADQLASVGGASNEPGGTCPLTPTLTTITTVTNSMPNLGCTGTGTFTITSGTINPNPGAAK